MKITYETEDVPNLIGVRFKMGGDLEFLPDAILSEARGKYVLADAETGAEGKLLTAERMAEVMTFFNMSQVAEEEPIKEIDG
jgi:hypothetical protein